MRKKLKKSVVMMLCLVAVLFVATACAGSPCNEADIKEYVTNNYGEATILSTTTQHETITCEFRDNQLGFEYTVTATGPKSSAKYSSTFERAYFNAMIEVVQSRVDELEGKYGANIQIANDNIENESVKILAKASVFSGKAEEAESLLEDLGTLYSTIDSRKYFNSARITANDGNGVPLGYYDLGQGKYVK